MKTAKSRVFGAILLILAIAVLVCGVFSMTAATEGTPFHNLYAAADGERTALVAASEAVVTAQEDLERTAKRAKDAAEESADAFEAAKEAFEVETSGAYDGETDVGLLGLILLEMQESGTDVTDVMDYYAPVYNADLMAQIDDTISTVTRAEGANDDALEALRAAIDAALALDAEAVLPELPLMKYADTCKTVRSTPAESLLAQAECLKLRSEVAGENSATLIAAGDEILAAVNTIIAANPVSIVSKVIEFANARFVDLLVIGVILLVVAFVLIAFPAWLARRWKSGLFRKGFWFTLTVALLGAALHYASGEMWDLMRQGVFDTLYMTIPATFFSYVVGLPLGVILVITSPGNIRPNSTLNNVMGTIVNFLRSIPFIILLVMLFDVTRLVMGSAIGTRAVIFPLFVSAFPYVARIVEGSLNEVDRGVIEAAESMGSTTWQIIRKVMIPEAMPSLINGAAICMTTILAYTAMAGSAGGDGLGKIAITYGLNYREYDIMYVSSLLLVALVQIIQIGGGILMRAADHRSR